MERQTKNRVLRHTTQRRTRIKMAAGKLGGGMSVLYVSTETADHKFYQLLYLTHLSRIIVIATSIGSRDLPATWTIV